MVDLAELTLTVSSDGVSEGTRSLQALEKAARGAEAASQKFATLAEKAWRASSQAIQDAAKAARSAVASFNGMDEAAQRVHHLRTKFDEVYRSASRLEIELQDLAEAKRLGVQITGGYSQALDRLILKHDKAAAAAAKQVQIYQQLSAAERLAATASDSQARYNTAAGINLGTGKSARDSAAVFRSELDELDRIAQLKAEQIGSVFSSQLSQSLIAGVGKSARESAAVFSTQLDELDRIARLKAEQIGSVFSSQLNARLIAGTSKSARDSASVFQADFKAYEQMSSAAERLRGRIDPLHAAQSRLNDELQHYNTLARGGYITTQELTKAQRLAQTQYQITAKAISEQGVAYASNRAQMANTVNLTHQLQDVAVTAAMGMNPLTIALQQGTQASMAFQGAKPAEAVSMLAGAFKSLMSVTALSTIGIIAVIAAIIQMIDWTAVASTVLVTLASVIESVAPYAAMAAAGLALLYAPAIVGGIVQVIALLGRLAVAATIAAAKMVAANPAVAFVLGVTAAVAAANIFRDELAAIFGRDIVADAKKAVNWTIGAFVGGYEAIKATWSMLPSAIGDLIYQAVNATITGVEKMLNFIIKKIDTFIGKIEGVIKTVSGWIGQDGVELGRIGEVKFDRPKNPYEGAANDALGAAREAFKTAQDTDYVGATYDVIARGASAAADKLRELASGLGKTDKKAKKAARDAEKEAERQQKAYDRLILSGNQFIAQKKFETEALFMTEEAAARLRKEQEYLNSAQRSNIDLSPKQRAELIGLAHAAADAEIGLKRMQEILQFGKDVIKGFFSDFRSSLEEGKGFWESFADAGTKALQKIADKLIEMALDQMINNFLRSLTGTFNLGGGLGLGGGGFTAAEYAFTAGGAGLFADGGFVSGPGTATSDSIPAWLSDGEFVVRAAAVAQPGMLRMLEAINSGNFAARMALGGLARVHAPANSGVQRYSGGGLARSQPASHGNAALNLQVDIQNNTNAQVEVGDPQQGPDGSLILPMLIREVKKEVASDIAGNGQIGRTIQGTFGINRRTR